jgi:hypothetical protein
MLPVTITRSVLQGVTNRSPDPEVYGPELIRCFRHGGEGCPRCGGSGYRPRTYGAGCGEPAGRPSRGGKALLGLRNRRGLNQPLYCLSCHPELGGGLAIFEEMSG